MNVLIATVVRNEADRYWVQALRAWSHFADEIIVLDDNSTDETIELAKDFGKVRILDTGPLSKRGLFGSEHRYRNCLFRGSLACADPGDIILWLDADMVPAQDPRKFFELEEFDAYAFALYDLWGPRKYRDEPPFWVGHTMPRVWAIRVSEEDKGRDYTFSRKNIHTGHIPGTWWEDTERRICALPQSHSLLHYGYFSEEDRQDRSRRYGRITHLLTDFEAAHAATILDEDPTLVPLMIETEWELS